MQLLGDAPLPQATHVSELANSWAIHRWIPFEAVDPRCFTSTLAYYSYCCLCAFVNSVVPNLLAIFKLCCCLSYVLSRELKVSVPCTYNVHATHEHGVSPERDGRHLEYRGHHSHYRSVPVTFTGEKIVIYRSCGVQVA